jgi:hypothetical protein
VKIYNQDGLVLVRTVNRELFVMGGGYLGQAISEEEGDEIAASLS